MLFYSLSWDFCCGLNFLIQFYWIIKFPQERMIIMLISRFCGSLRQRSVLKLWQLYGCKELETPLGSAAQSCPWMRVSLWPWKVKRKRNKTDWLYLSLPAHALWWDIPAEGPEEAEYWALTDFVESPLSERRTLSRQTDHIWPDHSGLISAQCLWRHHSRC